ncbi:MAG: hypothetical protein LBR81_03825 [Prevotellaceae bacterium]|nr:hypothetical protein [Prevotellaceae bacterium]
MMKKKKTPLNSQNLTKDVSQRQLHTNYLVAKKVLKHFDLDPDLIDTFTKKQRQTLIKFALAVPSIKAEKENTIPRQFLSIFRAEINRFMKENYWGDPENKLSYMELATSGLSFLFFIRILVEQGTYDNTPQQETARLIYDSFFKDKDFLFIFEESFFEVYSYIQNLMRRYSQINFRQYGFKYTWASNETESIRMKIRFTMDECQTKAFNHKGAYRTAFRLFYPPNGIFEPYNVTVPKHWIIPGIDEKYYFNIYVQSHVLHRFKERMDIFQAADRNLLVHYTLTNRIRVITNGKQKFLSCTIQTKQYDAHPLGYFSFFVQNNDLIVNTFLPLIHEKTPEGEKFHKIIPLSKEDIIYLGMDKISFFFEIDLNRIPFLKQALIDSGIMKSIEVLRSLFDKFTDKNGEESDPIDQQRTSFVKVFFDKIEEIKAIDAADFPTDAEVPCAENQ